MATVIFRTWDEYRAWSARMAEERTVEDEDVPLYRDNVRGDGNSDACTDRCPGDCEGDGDQLMWTAA